MMGFDADSEPQDNMDVMMEMANGVTCGQLTFAARDTEVDGVEIHEGDIMGLSPKGIEVVVYEPSLHEEEFFHSRVIRDLNAFKEMSDVILANRYHDEIADVLDKVYTRDLYFRD